MSENLKQNRYFSACAFLDEGNERIAKGLTDKDLDQIEVAQWIIELAQKKAKEEMESIHMKKRQLTDKLEEKITKKLKLNERKSSALFLKDG